MRKTEMPEWIAEAIAPLPPIATAAEVCAVLRVSRAKVSRLVTTGELRAVRTRESGSARVLIPREAVAAYLATLESGATVLPLRARRGLAG